MTGEPTRFSSIDIPPVTPTALGPGIELTSFTTGRTSDNWTVFIGPKPATYTYDKLALFPTRDQADTSANDLRGLLDTAGVYEDTALEVRAEDDPFHPGTEKTLGYSIRFGSEDTEAEVKSIEATLDGLLAGNAALNSRLMTAPGHTSEDGAATSTGPWAVNVLTIDPTLADIDVTRLVSSTATSVTVRKTTSERAAWAGATAAVNGGYFVMSEGDGVPGDPAGLFVDYAPATGQARASVLSEATNGRVVMTVRPDSTGKEDVRFETLRTTPKLTGYTSTNTSLGTIGIDGINRRPGFIRNCGGVGDSINGGSGDANLPRHDFTCKDASEVVIFTQDFGSTLPGGAQLSIALDSTGKIIKRSAQPDDLIKKRAAFVIQAIDSPGTPQVIPDLQRIAAGTRIAFDVDVNSTVDGSPVSFGKDDWVVNGGPLLVSNGVPAVDPVADGLAYDETLLWTWAVRRNPRTMVGVTGAGEILLVTVDGKQPDRSIGLSIPEAADLMRRLGAVQAMNLDGGGSTTMYSDPPDAAGRVINVPSDRNAQGARVERPVGDVIVVKPAATPAPVAAR